MSIATFFLAIALGAAPVSGAVPNQAASPEAVRYGCNDVVVMGRISNLRYDHVEIEDDLSGHGWASARVRVRRVLKGREPGRTLPVRYFTHAYLREDREFLLVLAPADGGDYLIRSHRLLAGGRLPTLARDCG